MQKKLFITLCLVGVLAILDNVEAEGFCPPKSRIVCIRSITKCCSDDDCPYGKICCQENCGNKCNDISYEETTGKRVYFSESCKIDEY
uniref:U17-Liphistoxin-Lsp1a_1 n=1 Tax=Liphistius sp. SGP-2016 TaxID=1905180 RepID=A0A4Q8K556_9ARAC